MSRLKIVILTNDAERFRGALMLAMAHVAMGGSAALFLQLDAVALAATQFRASNDAAHQAAGLPSLAALVDDALDADIRITLCQTGLALTGLDAGALNPRLEPSGPIAFLQGMAEGDRLLSV
jgi:predicted peroxiredoxin